MLRYKLRLATAVSVQVFAQVFQSPRDYQHMLRYIYAVLLLTSTKTKVECVAVFDTLLMLNMNLKFLPSFVKLARFEKLKGKVCTLVSCKLVVIVRAQLKWSDRVCTVAYCLLNTEHESLKVGLSCPCTRCHFSHT